MESGYKSSRREFLAGSLGAVAAGCSLAGFPLPGMPRDTAKGSYREASEYTSSITGRHGKLRDDFTVPELSDISEAMDLLEARIGSLQPYYFDFGKLRYDPSVKNKAILKDREKVRYEFPGYEVRAHVDCAFPPRISLAPRDVIDEWNDYEKKNGIWASGEILSRDFRECSLHEMNHQVAYLTFGDGLLGPNWHPRPNAPKFLQDWYDLSMEIRKRAEPLLQMNGRWENKRPNGWPSLSSRLSMNNPSSECLADCAVFAEMNMKDYGRDQWLKRRVELVNDSFFPAVKSFVSSF